MTETEIQKEILDWLAQRGYFCWRNQNMPTRRRQNLKHVLRGMPDIFILADGVFIGVEVKTDEGKLSKEQIERGDEIHKHKGRYIVVRSLQELINVFTADGMMIVAPHSMLNGHNKKYLDRV